MISDCHRETVCTCQYSIAAGWQHSSGAGAGGVQSPSYSEDCGCTDAVPQPNDNVVSAVSAPPVPRLNTVGFAHRASNDWGNMLVTDFLEGSARCFPNHLALMDGQRRVTYQALNAAADRIAGALAAAGVQAGDRVVLYLNDCLESVVALFAVLKAGGVFSIVNATTKRDKLALILENSDPRAIVVDRVHAETVAGLDRLNASLAYVLIVGDEVPAGLAAVGSAETWAQALARELPRPSVQPIDVDLATIIYTSGSTGTPKGVMATHANVVAATTSINAYLMNTEDDVILDALPLSFDYGLYQVFLAFQAGARLVLERGFRYPAYIYQRMREEGVTGFPGVPTIFSLMLQHRGRPGELPALRYLTNTAAALPVSHIDRIRALFPQARLVSMYGLTECKRVSYLPPEDLDRKPGSVGVAIPNTEVYLVDEAGRRLPAGATGELVVRGSHVMRGYWRDPIATAERYRPGPIPGETVLFTGDLMHMDEDGYLYFIGRKDDIIKSRGEKVSPKEVEACVYTLEGVLDAAVVGVPDALLGEAVTLIASIAHGSLIDERTLRQYCRDRLEDYMVPTIVQIWPELPKTPAGKIDKLTIRQRLADEESGSNPAPAELAAAVKGA
jgi:long-chain acyl-CoA synthetase